MKKYLLVSILSVITLSAAAQLNAPLQTGPADKATGVYIDETLTWNPSTGGTVTGYDCQLDIDSTFSNPVNLPIYGTGGVTDLLDYNQVYFWRVRSKNATSTSAWSTIRSYTTFNDEFTNLNPKQANRNPELTLTWDTISGSDSYTIEIATNPSFTGSKTYSVPKPNPDSAKGGFAHLELSNLLFGTTYYWRVKSNHSLAQSAFSAAENFSTIASVNLNEPADNDIDKFAKTKLVCRNTKGVTEYRFQICDDSTFNENSPYFHTHIALQLDFPDYYNAGGTLVTPPISVNALYMSYGTDYYWRVQGVNNASVSQWSPIRKFTTIDEVVLESPVNDAAGLGNRGVVFTWKKSNGAQGYLMQLDTSMAFSAPRKIETFGDSGVSVTLDIKKTSEDYFWRVKAKHFRDSTNWSSIRSFYGTPVGVAKINETRDFGMFPNPATDVVFFDLNAKVEGDAIIEIYSVLGNKVDQLQVKNVLGDKKIEYNTSNLQRGVYMVVVSLNGQKETQRLSIK